MWQNCLKSLISAVGVQNVVILPFCILLYANFNHLGENEAAACQQSRNTFVVVRYIVGTILAESVADCYVSIVLPSWCRVLLSAFVFCTFDTFSASFPAIEY